MVVNKFNRRNFLKNGRRCRGRTFNYRHFPFSTSETWVLFASVGRAGDYKALVCLYLGGGADSFNMVVPRSGSEYQDYTNTRSNLALSQDDILPVSPLNIAG